MSEMLNFYTSQQCYICDKYNSKENKPRNILYCFIWCEAYTESQLNNLAKIFEIDILKKKSEINLYEVIE